MVLKNSKQGKGQAHADESFLLTINNGKQMNRGGNKQVRTMSPDNIIQDIIRCKILSAHTGAGRRS